MGVVSLFLQFSGLLKLPLGAQTTSVDESSAAQGTAAMFLLWDRHLQVLQMGLLQCACFESLVDGAKDHT